jgi:DNA-binding NarL/FixJ family response regulator
MTLTTEDKNLALAIRDYQRGSGVAEIITEYGISETELTEAVRAARIPLRQPVMTDRQRALRTVERLYRDGLSQSMIARRLRLKPETIERALKDIVREAET